MSTEPYEVYAIRYAHHERRASANFLGGDPHDGPMPLDYFLWAIKGNGRTFVVDTGFDEAMARKRGREFLLKPEDGLHSIGIDHTKVEDVILTHLHHDHCGNHHLFPKARFHVQDSEVSYCTGRAMCHHMLRHAFEEEDIVQMVRRVFTGRACFHDGTSELAPGITLHHVGGHTQGIQAVRVLTRRGYLVLASDVTHLYANMERRTPFPAVHNVFTAIEGFEKIERLASAKDMIIPGHDPLVLSKYPAVSSSISGVVRLDGDPQ